MRFALIMAGGSGTRFWPKSSAKNPKQFLALVGKRSQIQLTFDRLKGIVDKKNRWVVTTQLLAAKTRSHLPGIELLAEPLGRNTMAAVCWGAWAAAKRDPEACLIALPADAHIADQKNYRESVERAFSIASNENRIVCLGIKPTFAATGYGYIQSGGPLGGDSRGHRLATDLTAADGFSVQDPALEIKRFVEKPDEATARTFLSSGDYTWNAGIFIFKASVLMDEVRKLAPEFGVFFDKYIGSSKKIKLGYKSLPKVSVDVALMEKTKKGAVVPGDFGWNDIGSWRALEEVISNNDPAGLIRAKAGHLALDSSGMIVDVTDQKFVGLIGVKDLIVVETPNALLICHKKNSEQVKELVGSIEKNKKLKRLL